MSSDHIDQLATTTLPDRLELMIHPDDADQALVAGVQFARSLVGAEPVDFTLALGEQQALVQKAVLEAGFPNRKARAAGEAFEDGARVEWKRIGSVERPAVWGNA